VSTNNRRNCSTRKKNYPHENWLKLLSFSFTEILLQIILKNTAYKSFPPLFRLLNQIAKIGSIERQFLLNIGTIPKLVDLYVNAPLQDSTIGNFKKLVSVINTLVCGCGTKYSGKIAPPTHIDGTKLLLPSGDQEKVLSVPFLSRAIRLNINFKRLSKILIHWSWENENLTETIIKLLSEMIATKPDKFEAEKTRNYFEILSALLAVQDSLQKKRVKLFIVPFLDVLNAKKELKDRIPECLEWVRQLQRLIETETEVRNWLRKNESKWTWIPKWYNKAMSGNTSTLDTNSTSSK